MTDLYLYIYDLSKGMARQFSPMFLGKQIDGVWHTGIVAFGEEWYFGNDGINSCPPKGTLLGEPNQMLHLGKTDLKEDEFLEIIRQMAESTYKIGTYNLLEHNCNNFSNDLSMIIVGKPIPQYIIDLPKEIMNTSIGPMLRPLLEQAVDPLQNDGQIKIPKYLSQKQETECVLPTTAILFKPEIRNELPNLIRNSEIKLEINENNLLIEIKEYLEQTEEKWSISGNHIKLLFELYTNHLKEVSHSETLLTIFQNISLNKNLAELIVQNDMFVNNFIPKIKNSELNLKINSLRTLSNVCTHLSISKMLLTRNQDFYFKELSEYILTEPTNETDLDMHEACISFFYNLIVAFELDNHLSDMNALTLGCALLERMPKMKLKPKSIYQILTLLRTCLTVSKDMKDLAISMNFDLSKYQSNELDKDASEDSLKKVLKSVSNILSDKN